MSKISQKDYKKKILKLEKIEKQLKITKEKIFGNEDHFSNIEKLNALDKLIGYLVRNGKDSGIPMEVLIDIANDYEKKKEEQS